jgi:leader peptidase (prepilin peptidase) / N-methyltransferase
MADTFIASPLLPLLVAPFVGSFLGVLILRLPAGAPVVFARSACNRCGSRLDALDLVPLASYALLRGRCRHCGQAIGWFNPAVELAAVAVALWAVLAEQNIAEPDIAELWAGCVLGWTLLALTWIDWTELLLPDVLTLPLLLAGLGLTSAWEPDALTDHCLSAALGYLAFQGLAAGYRWLRGRDGLGGGDAKLIAAAGAWCGLAALPFIVLTSALLGLLAALGLAVAGAGMTSRTQIPFGPCIALAFWLAWIHPGLVEDLTQLLGSS